MAVLRDRLLGWAAARWNTASVTVPEADGRDHSTRRQVFVITVTGVAVVALIVTTIGIGWKHNVHGWWLFLAVESVGFPFVIAGFVVWWRRPGNRFGSLMVIAGAAWYIGNLQESANPVFFAVGYWLIFIQCPILSHLILTFPNGRFLRSFDRWLVIIGYVGNLTVQGVRYLREGSQGKIGPWQTISPPKSTLGDVLSFLAIVLTVFTFWSVLERWRVANVAARRLYAPVWLAIMFTGLVVVANTVVAILSFAQQVQLTLILCYGIWLATLPFAFLVGLLRVRFAFLGIANLVLELQHASSPDRLCDLLGTTLGDPGLILGFWSAESAEYVDAEGWRVIPSPSGEARAVTFVESDGSPVAVLVHDSALAEQQVLINAVVGVARSALENARPHVAQLAEIQASRTRIAEDALDDRRKIERDLHDGVQGRLLWLIHLTEQARVAATSDTQRETLVQQLNELVGEIRNAHTVLRDLTQGIHPAILNTQGLAAAVEELALRTSTPVVVGLPRKRWPTAVQATAFFTISEAVSNAVKHAQARQISIRGWEQGRQLIIEIADDGVGGTDYDSRGLRGMRDRVNALGGSFSLHSPSGQGTRIVLELPCV